MEISFKTQGDIQIIEIDGVMGDPEAAAIRVKLEQKINQGRAKVLFDLTNFAVENDASRKLILGVISYSVNRGTLAACCGVKPAQLPLLILPGPKQVKIFFTKIEGLDYLQKNTPLDPKANLGAKRKTEDDIKEEAILKLLERYEAFQHTDEDDPFRLEFLIEQYKTAPNNEALLIEHKAQDAFVLKQTEIQNLEKECDELAKQVKALMQYRKTPLSGKELQHKQESLLKEAEEIKTAVQKLRAAIDENKKGIAKAKENQVNARKKSAENISELEENIKSTSENNIREAADLQALDAQEQAQLEARLNKPK